MLSKTIKARIARDIDVDALQLYRAKPSYGDRVSTEIRVDPGLLGDQIDRSRFRILPPIDRLGKLLEGKLRNDGVGFAMQINDNGAHAYSAAQGWARNAAIAANDKRAWDSNTRQHIASISKFFSAAMILPLLARKGIPLTARIADYLPAHWKLGQLATWATFHSVLGHNAFFESNITYDEIKRHLEITAMGIAIPWHYSNTNYALARLLIPVINGTLDRNVNYGAAFNMPQLNDVFWDVLTRKHFNQYAQDNLWSKMGIRHARLSSLLGLRRLAPFNQLQEIANNALSYPLPLTASSIGEDITEDMTGSAGTVGWHLSVNELLQAAHHIRRGTVISRTQLRLMQKEGYGSFAMATDNGGTINYHDGAWSGAAGHVSMLALLPGRRELAILSNNKRDNKGQGLQLPSLRDHVLSAYNEALRP
ncbi:serine hydrolase domain-containing protein [Devosia lacusdianchii]|jgi:hypothetical protein|uniref:serine hydrolase domain-containing protein n=1 Tax=Devosia lacusdianchii TaxID=2917991 RepID=UPI001F062DE7|nr:serine hydrolase domain-containing protein [Devosia sp. JXJ CY 41]